MMNMEFDVESFMSDVAAALDHESPQPPAGAAEGDYGKANPHLDTSDRAAFSAFEDFFQYPPDEHTNTPPAGRSSRSDSLRSVEFLSSRERRDGFEDPDESHNGAPVSIDLGVCALISHRQVV